MSAPVGRGLPASAARRLVLVAACVGMTIAIGCQEGSGPPSCQKNRPTGEVHWETGGGPIGGGGAYSGSTADGGAWWADGGGGGLGSSTPSEDEVAKKLAELPGVTIVAEGPLGDDPRYFLLEIEQPADHDDPAGQTFQQRISLLHRSFDAPMVLASTGYDLYTEEPTEVTALVGANQLMVEHRFFTPSRPDPADWKDLRIWQAASDHHRIVDAFKVLYFGNWLSTGASKGGMTSVYHRRFFPDDVVGTIAYVAPHSYGDADARYVDFVANVGDPACYQALEDFQREVLIRRSEMTARMLLQSGDDGYSQLGVDAALDYAVIELVFAFWQYKSANLCASIPTAASSDDEVWQFLNTVDPPAAWSDVAFFRFEPYYYQAAVQLGYPGYDDSAIADLLTLPPGSDVAINQVAPGPTKEMTLDVVAMVDVANWLANEGSRMMFIYGENDPYSAAAFELGNAKESHLFVVPSGNHGAMVADLAADSKSTALQAIGLWAGVAPKPPPPEVVEKQRAARLDLRAP